LFDRIGMKGRLAGGGIYLTGFTRFPALTGLEWDTVLLETHCSGTPSRSDRSTDYEKGRLGRSLAHPGQGVEASFLGVAGLDSVLAGLDSPEDLESAVAGFASEPPASFLA